MDDTDRNPIPPAQDEEDDELRRRLKALGYLENPLDKFFIGGLHARTGVLAANLKVAAKVGVLGGVFLGVVTALSMGLLTPEAFPTAVPLVKLALYFSLIFTVLFAVLELAIGLVVTVLGKASRKLFTRTGMIALYSGVFAGLVIFAYGTLWWWAGSSNTAVSSPRTVAAFVIVAVLAAGVGLLTRRAVTALLALLGGADLTARGKGRATKLYFAILVCGIVVFAGYRLATAKPAPRGMVDYGASQPKVSVTLVAIDGASADFFEYLSSRDMLANLDALAAKGRVVPLVKPVLHVSPSVWTTVATGVEPAKHQVTSYSAQEIPGLGFYIKDRTGFGLYDALLAALPEMGLSRRAPLERRTAAFPALWDILGTSSGVSNWWGTWPASDSHAFVVTDRMYPKLQTARALHETPEFEAEGYPRSLFDKLVAYPLDNVKFAENPLSASQDLDRFSVAALMEGLKAHPGVVFSAVYLPGLDIYENSLYERLANGWSMAAAARVSDQAAEYWRFVDGLIAPVLATADAEHVVFVVTDPGMLKPPEQRPPGRTAKGFCLMAGGPVIQGRPRLSMKLVDIAPAVLYLLDLPVSAEMDGRVPIEAFDRQYVLEHPVRMIPTFGRLEVKAPGGYSVDTQLVDRLKSLGYLQ